MADPTNPWAQNPWATNSWEASDWEDAIWLILALELTQNPTINELMRPFMVLTFGNESLTFVDLLDLLNRSQTGQLTPEEVITIVRMGIFYTTVWMDWRYAPGNLQRWLKAGAQTPSESLVLDDELFKPLQVIKDEVCDAFNLDVKDRIDERLRAASGEKFPASAVEITGPDGLPILISPQLSNLRAGGRELIYKEVEVMPFPDSSADLYYALGSVRLVCRMTVETKILEAGRRWQVEIKGLECWMHDTYTWQKEDPIGFYFPLNLYDRLNLTPEQRVVFDMWLQQKGIPASIFETVNLPEATLGDLEGQEIKTASGTTYKPGSFLVLSGPWSYTASDLDCFEWTYEVSI